MKFMGLAPVITEMLPASGLHQILPAVNWTSFRLSLELTCNSCLMWPCLSKDDNLLIECGICKWSKVHMIFRGPIGQTLVWPLFLQCYPTPSPSLVIKVPFRAFACPSSISTWSSFVRSLLGALRSSTRCQVQHWVWLLVIT